MANLYDITKELAYLQDALEESDEAPEGLWEYAMSMQGEFEDKMAGYAKVLRNLAAERDAAMAEKVRLEKRADRLDAAIAWMKENVLRSMQRLNVTRVDTTIGTWRTRKNPWKVIVDDETKLPEEFLIPQLPKVDKAALRHRLLDTGEIIDGAHLEQTEGVVFR